MVKFNLAIRGASGTQRVHCQGSGMSHYGTANGNLRTGNKGVMLSRQGLTMPAINIKQLNYLIPASNRHQRPGFMRSDRGALKPRKET